jgi:hypothetical protein
MQNNIYQRTLARLKSFFKWLNSPRQEVTELPDPKENLWTDTKTKQFAVVAETPQEAHSKAGLPRFGDKLSFVYECDSIRSTQVSPHLYLVTVMFTEVR